MKVDSFFVHSTTTHYGSNTCILFFDSAVSQKEKNSLQINAHINHPDSVFTLVSKQVGSEAFVLAKQIEYCLEMRSIYVTSFFA